MKYDNQLRYAVNIIHDFNGSIPLAAWLRDFFRQHKQMGSHDRKTVAGMVYGYYRLGQAAFNSVEERIIAALFLTDAPVALRDHFRTKISVENGQSSHAPVHNIFPWKDQLSDDIEAAQFEQSFLVQPDVFLRIRPGKNEEVFRKLREADIPYSLCGDDCVQLPPFAKADSVLVFDDEVVVQDRNSQRTGSLLRDEALPEGGISVWDCCAASGGKSIMIYDLLKNVRLTVSDIRNSIIENLRSRLRVAGIQAFTSFTADLSVETSRLPKEKYDLIIADVPCTGSGTWARTPEQLYFFRENKIDQYQALQKKIVSRVLPFLKKNGLLLYITCSVFRKENEEMAGFIVEEGRLTLRTQTLLKGYDQKADTLFAALFIN